MARRRSALGAEAVTPETQAQGAARDGFVAYDEPDRPATFAVDLAVKNIGGDPADFRRGMPPSTSSTST
jgi:hypothetical protein